MNKRRQIPGILVIFYQIFRFRAVKNTISVTEGHTVTIHDDSKWLLPDMFVTNWFLQEIFVMTVILFLLGVEIEGHQRRVTAGDGPIGRPPSDGTPPLRGSVCQPTCQWGRRPELPGAAG